MPESRRFDPQRRVCFRGGFDFRVVAELDSPRLVLQIRTGAVRLQACHREGSIDNLQQLAGRSLLPLRRITGARTVLCTLQGQEIQRAAREEGTYLFVRHPSWSASVPVLAQKRRRWEVRFYLPAPRYPAGLHSSLNAMSCNVGCGF